MSYFTLHSMPASLTEFIAYWSALYDFPNDYRYKENIGAETLTEDNLLELLKWKNGMDRLSSTKRYYYDEALKNLALLNELKKEWNEQKFISVFEPAVHATIWSIFLMHIVQPELNPIFDQHVYRAFHFIQHGETAELGIDSSLRFDFYRHQYRPFFNALVKESGCKSKQLDEAIFTYGRFLNSYPTLLPK
jgi:hypothetical protein